MQPFLKKAVNMKTRYYVSHVIKLNGMFGKFARSTNDLAVLELDKDKLFYFPGYGLPLHWQLQMVLHDFDPANHTLQELVSFFEWLELNKPYGSNNSSNNNFSSKIPVGTNDNKPNNRKHKTEDNTVSFSGNKYALFMTKEITLVMSAIPLRKLGKTVNQVSNPSRVTRIKNRSQRAS